MVITVKKIDDSMGSVQALIKDNGVASYASIPSMSRGRLHKENPSTTRTDFQRDRDRVMHSKSFRRLKHKTQVFVDNKGDHYRTRLSHSIEVSQVARSLARSLYVDEDLAETCALAHDLGHTPFAHVGEDALKECMQPYGGFDHNDQTLRVVTLLENSYPSFDGMNLTWESLEGLVKHNGPVIVDGGDKKLETTLDWLKDQTDLMLGTYASIEAQIAGLSDDIAYNSHDLDDGLSAEYFVLEEVRHIPLLNELMEKTKAQYPDISQDRFDSQVVRELLGAMVSDVRLETQKRLVKLNPSSADDVRYADVAMVGFSAEMQETDKLLRSFLWDRFYMHQHVSRQRFKVYKVVQGLFNAFMENERALPFDWREASYKTPEGVSEKNWSARVVADYVASMTDRYAISTHRELFDPYSQF